MSESSGGPGPPEPFNLYNVIHRGEMPAVNDQPKRSTYKAMKTAFFTHPSDAEKYFVLGGESIRKMDIFDIYDGLQLITKEEFKNCTILKSGDVLIQTQSAQQIEALKTVTTFGNDKQPVSISENGVLNQSHALIRCKQIMKVEIERIIKKLADQNVINVQRLQRKENNVYVDTATHLLTFSTPVCPAEVRVGFIHLKTELYIPAPFRCVLCQRIGHSKKRCKSNQNKHVCGFCAQETHGDKPCEHPAKCVNCNGNHPSFSKNCPIYLEEKEINAIRVTMRIPYNLARQEYRRRRSPPSYGIHPMPTTRPSFSSVLQSSTTSTSSMDASISKSETKRPTASTGAIPKSNRSLNYSSKMTLKGVKRLINESKSNAHSIDKSHFLKDFDTLMKPQIDTNHSQSANNSQSNYSQKTENIAHLNQTHSQTNSLNIEIESSQIGSSLPNLPIPPINPAPNLLPHPKPPDPSVSHETITEISDSNMSEDDDHSLKVTSNG